MTTRNPGLLLIAATLVAAPAIAREPTKQCISLLAIKAETAETNSRLIFHTGDGRAFINHLPAPCDGLQSINALGKLRLNASGERLCAGDTVTLSDATCKLGAFEAVSEMTITEFLRR